MRVDVAKPGPRRKLRGVLPNLPEAADERACVEPVIRIPETTRRDRRPGLHRFGRSSPDVLPSRDQFGVAIDGENGSPLRSDTIELTASRSAARGSTAGISQVALAEKTWRMSKRRAPSRHSDRTGSARTPTSC